MGFFELASVLVVLAGILSFLNYRYLKLPTTIGLMSIALACSMALVVLGGVAIPLRSEATKLMSGVQFGDTLLDGMLAFLLFAGSLHLDLHDLRREWLPIGLLALAQTALSALAVGGGIDFVLPLLGLNLSLISCLMFGALSSPTDPVAVLGIMKSAGAPKPLETQIAGESLLNHGIGVVLFLALLDAQSVGHAPELRTVCLLILQEFAGGLLLGSLAGYVTYLMLRPVENDQVEILLTLGLAMGA